MVPLIGGMNNEPCHLTASGERLSGEGQVSSKYRHELLGAATYKPVVFSKFVNGVYNIKVWPRFWGGIQAQPFFQFRPSSSGTLFRGAADPGCVTVSQAFSTTRRTALPVFQETVACLKTLWVRGSWERRAYEKKVASARWGRIR